MVVHQIDQLLTASNNEKLCNTVDYFYDLGEKLKLTSKNPQPYYTTFRCIYCLLYDSHLFIKLRVLKFFS